MTTRPLGPPALIPDDPGPWSVVTQVLRGRSGRPGRRYAEPPRGLMLAQPPAVDAPLVGFDPGLATVGAGPLRLSAAAREPAWALEFVDDATVCGVSPNVVRRWTLPGLVPAGEERPGADPAADIPAPYAVADIAAAQPIAVSPDGALRAVAVAEGTGALAVGLLRARDGALVRWFRGARAAAWSPDGSHLVLGGDWGLLLAEAA